MFHVDRETCYQSQHHGIGIDSASCRGMPPLYVCSNEQARAAVSIETNIQGRRITNGITILCHIRLPGLILMGRSISYRESFAQNIEAHIQSLNPSAKRLYNEIRQLPAPLHLRIVPLVCGITNVRFSANFLRTVARAN